MNKWISVADKTPETPDPVLAVAVPHGEQEPRVYAMCYVYSRWSDDEEWVGGWRCAQGDGYDIPTTVTHWMPMPEPPHRELTLNRGSMRYFIDTHFPDRTADLTQVLLHYGEIAADFKISSTLGFKKSIKPREWYIEFQHEGMTLRVWPYGQYVGCRPDGVYHIADVMTNIEGNGFIIHYLSDGTIKAGRTYEGG